MNEIEVQPAEHIAGELSSPGDKSISHRAIMLGSLANGTSRFSNFLMGEDCLSTVSVFKELGVRIRFNGTNVEIDGDGLNGLKQPKHELYLGNSGTTMRLLAGILAAQPFDSVLTGDMSLMGRPMQRIVQPLQKMGARIEASGEKKTAPLYIHGSTLNGIHFQEEKGSAQIKSAVLLAGLYANGETVVEEQRPSRDHTERMLAHFKASFRKNGSNSCIKKTDHLTASEFAIPGDISSAAFFIVAASILPRSEITITDVGLNPTRCGILTVLRQMGADITVTVTNEIPEPVGTIVARSSQLTSASIDKSIIPYLIDELPILMIAAAAAKGKTTISGAQELRVKETDRLHSMTVGLQAIGVDIQEQKDGAIINGNDGTRWKGGATVDSFEDHRTAMSLAVAALFAEEPIRIIKSSCVSISYPDFFKLIEMVRK